MQTKPVDKESEAEAARRLAEALEAERRLSAELVAALQTERSSLVAGRLEELYAACHERVRLVEELGAAQQASAAALEALSAGPELSAAIKQVARRHRPRLRELRAEINRLRRQAAALCEENRLYVGEALACIDEAVSILTGAATEPRTYGERAKSGPAVISSEV